MSQDQQKLLDEVFVLLEEIASLIFFKIKTVIQVSKLAKKIKKRWNSTKISDIELVF